MNDKEEIDEAIIASEKKRAGVIEGKRVAEEALKDMKRWNEEHRG